MESRDWLHLPPEFGGSTDPVRRNPFPPGTTLHQIWVQATAIAEKEFLEFQQFLADPKRLEEAATNPPSPIEWWVVPVGCKFEIWAKRGAYVVYDDDSLSSYERWLVGYANTWLDALARLFEKNPPPFHPEPVLIELRNLLGRRVLHWRGEGRRFRDEQIEFRRSLDPPKAVGPEVKKKRKTLLAAYRRKHKLTAEGLASKVGVSTTGIRGLVNEDRNRYSEATQSNFLERLDISKEDWYSS